MTKKNKDVKVLTREQVEDMIINKEIEDCMNDHEYLRETLLFGYKGLLKMSNKELLSNYYESLGDNAEKIEIKKRGKK